MKIKNVFYKNLMGQGSYQLIRPLGDLSDHPEFQPHFSPAQMLAMGVFEGFYLNLCQEEYPAEWFKNARLSESADPALNYFGVKSRTSLQHWRAKGWITEHDPRGWFEWYCRFWMVNNHAAAITDLAQYGYPDLVPAAVESQRRHLQLWRNLPNIADELGPEPFSDFLPLRTPRVGRQIDKKLIHVRLEAKWLRPETICQAASFGFASSRCPQIAAGVLLSN